MLKGDILYMVLLLSHVVYEILSMSVKGLNRYVSICVKVQLGLCIKEPLADKWLQTEIVNDSIRVLYFQIH